MKLSKLMVVALAVCLLAVYSFAADDGKTEKEGYTGVEHEAHWHEIEGDLLDTFHNPWEGATMGLDVRFRWAYAENQDQLSDDVANDTDNYTRTRTRWSFKQIIDEDIEFNSRLTWEFFTWHKPVSAASSVDFDEVIFDHLNFKFKNAFDMPLTITVGRQDIIMGTGWLILEGTPADGSRTIFFDAIRATYDLEDIESVLDVAYIQQYDSESKYIKPFNHGASARHSTLGTDEKGLIVYLTNKSIENTKLEGYYIYKNDKRSSIATTAVAVDAEIHTIGAAIDASIDDNWSYRAELAKQFGDKDGANLDALGFNSRVKYALNDDVSGVLFADYEYLSGDDPDTSANEQFDPLWGNYPQSARGNNMPLTFTALEDSPAEVSNMHRLGFGYNFKPVQNWKFYAIYNLMWADEADDLGDNADIDDSDKFRGQMITAKATFTCCKNLSYHFALDYFMPGNYYDGDRDNAIFTRFNVEYTF